MEHVESSNVFSHVSAAVIHGLPVNWKDLKLVTMIRRTPGHGIGGPQLRVRNTRLASSEVEVLDGLPVTTLERTVCDLARLSPFEWGVVAADAALHRGHSADMLKATLWAHPRLHGVAKAKRVLSFADGLSESPAESISRVAMARFGLPTPVLQFEIFDDDGVLVARSDFGWPDLGVVGGRWEGEVLGAPQAGATGRRRRDAREGARTAHPTLWVLAGALGWKGCQ